MPHSQLPRVIKQATMFNVLIYLQITNNINFL